MSIWYNDLGSTGGCGTVVNVFAGDSNVIGRGGSYALSSNVSDVSSNVASSAYVVNEVNLKCDAASNAAFDAGLAAASAVVDASNATAAVAAASSAASAASSAANAAQALATGTSNDYYPFKAWSSNAAQPTGFKLYGGTSATFCNVSVNTSNAPYVLSVQGSAGCLGLSVERGALSSGVTLPTLYGLASGVTPLPALLSDSNVSVPLGTSMASSNYSLTCTIQGPRSDAWRSTVVSKTASNFVVSVYGPPSTSNASLNWVAIG